MISFSLGASTPLLLSFLLVILSLNLSHGYRILGVVHVAAKSHHIVGSALMKELARRGHEVTMISPFPLDTPMANYTDVPALAVMEAMKKQKNDLFKSHDRNIIENFVTFHQMGLTITEAVLTEPAVQQLMHSNRTFDVVICEVFLSEALYGLAEHFGAPLVGLGTFGAVLWNNDMVGSPSPPSYVPNALLHFTDRMTLPQRIANLAFATFERLLADFYYLPRQEALYRTHFPHATRTLLEVRRNAALVLLNQHVSLSFPRPYMPNHIEVGGLHISRERRPLPTDLQRFLDDATEGAIYFSLGSNLRSRDLPPEKRAAILSALRGLRQRVLWKFEEPQLQGKPANVLIRDWFPQDDVLAHPRVRAFITHGGLLSTTESIYHGKPFVGIPIFGDQFLNMARADAGGYGITLDYKELTADGLAAAIKRVLEEPSYTRRVRAMSARYRDQPLQPLALAAHWVEHVARHGGARYLHCAGLDLGFWQYHSIDAMLILYGGALSALLLVVLLVRCTCRAAMRRWRLQVREKPKQKKQ